MKIIVCGSRHAEKTIELKDRYYAVLDEYLHNWWNEWSDKLTIIQGECTWVDTMIKDLVWAEGIAVVGVAANWDAYGKRAGPIRNRWMMRLKPDLVVGFHHDWESAKGTTDMLNAAKAVNVETLRVHV